jgi:hypothetical protein
LTKSAAAAFLREPRKKSEERERVLIIINQVGPTKMQKKRMAKRMIQNHNVHNI